MATEMTVRSYLKRQYWNKILAAYAAMLVFFVMLISSINLDLVPEARLALIVLGLIAVMIAAFKDGIRCPGCQQNLYKILPWQSSRFPISCEVKVCPACKLDLDTPYIEN